MAVLGTCTAFSSSFSLFCLFRFGCGMALSGQSLNSFSLSEILRTSYNEQTSAFLLTCRVTPGCVCDFEVVEWIPTRVRTVVGTITGYSYTFGQLILAAVAYFIRDWRWLTLAVSLPYYIFFLYAW